MDISAALPTFLITLREGFEAALVVGIVLACLKKAQQQQLNRWVFAGVLAGIGTSVAVGAVLYGLLQQLDATDAAFAGAIKPFLESGFAITAIALLSWMLIWMTQQARSLKAEVEASIKDSLEQQAAGWSVFGLIFVAVVREGFETVLFILANLQQGAAIASLGAVAGLLGAAAIGVALFQWGVRINIRLFFQVMGVALLFIVAGLVVSALKNANAGMATLDLCFSSDSCILGPLVWDASNVLPDKEFPGIVLKTLLGYRDRLYLAQAIGYLAFLFPVGALYLRSLGGQPPVSPTPAQTASSQQ